MWARRTYLWSNATCSHNNSLRGREREKEREGREREEGGRWQAPNLYTADKHRVRGEALKTEICSEINLSVHLSLDYSY